MNDQKIQFIPGITFCELNPQNNALKNDFIQNIFSTGILYLPVLAGLVAGKQIKICKGFLSQAYMREQIKPSNSQFAQWLMFHTSGMAIELTWDGFDIDEAIMICNTLCDVINEGSRYVIDQQACRISIYRIASSTAKVIQKVDQDTTREIKKRTIALQIPKS